MKPQSTLEVITPALAAEYLKLNTHNRPCDHKRVGELSGAMARSEFVCNGDTIRFSVDNVLLDGQGRLKACVATGIPFETFVVRGLPREAFETIDIGKKRSVADTLSLHGERNTAKLARAMRFILMYENGSYNNAKFSPRQVKEGLLRYPGLRYWIDHSSMLYRVTSHAAMVLAIGYLGSLTRRQQAEEFRRLMIDGVDMSKGSPVLALRERLQQDRAAVSKLPASYVAQIAIHAYNAFVRGDTRAILKGNKDSFELPRVVK